MIRIIWMILIPWLDIRHIWEELPLARLLIFCSCDDSVVFLVASVRGLNVLFDVSTSSVTTRTLINSISAAASHVRNSDEQRQVERRMDPSLDIDNASPPPVKELQARCLFTYTNYNTLLYFNSPHNIISSSKSLNTTSSSHNLSRYHDSSLLTLRLLSTTTRDRSSMPKVLQMLKQPRLAREPGIT